MASKCSGCSTDAERLARPRKPIRAAKKPKRPRPKILVKNDVFRGWKTCPRCEGKGLVED